VVVTDKARNQPQQLPVYHYIPVFDAVTGSGIRPNRVPLAACDLGLGALGVGCGCGVWGVGCGVWGVGCGFWTDKHDSLRATCAAGQ
jgi:hypothetical protein